MMNILRGTTEMKALKSKKRVRHAYVGNKTKNGYWIWKLRTNNAPGSLLFQIDIKTLQKTWININHTTFVWRGIPWKTKIAWASDRLKNCVAGRQNHDTCGGKVSSGQATLECGWLWRKGARELGRFGLLDIGAYDWSSRISGLLRLSGIVPFCGRWLSPWTRLERYVTDQLIR